MAYKFVNIGGHDFSADKLREIADTMDNPDKLLPFECQNISQYIKRIVENE